MYPTLTPKEIIEKRSEIARVLCARQIYILNNPDCENIVLTQNDLDTVPRYMLRQMIRKITP